MDAIPRAALDWLTAEVEGLSADARKRVLRVLESIEWTPDDAASVARCRDVVVQAIAAVVPSYAAAAAQAGADFYDAVREAAVGEALGAPAASGYESAAAAGAVRAFVQSIVGGGAAEPFNGLVLDRVDRDVRRAANVGVAAAAARDPLRPRYARVPSGGETCGFCLMLASFGFAYTTPEAASHAHPGCDCRVVPGFDGAAVEGYDPAGMHWRLTECLDALGGRDGVRADWEALPEAERAALAARHGNKRGDAFDAYLNGRLAAEIELRDPMWYRTGRHSGITFTDDSVRRLKEAEWRKNKPGEKKTAEKLNLLGYKTEFWDDETHLRRPNGQGQTTVSRADLSSGIEIKTVYESASENTFKSHMRSVANKSGVRFPVFDISENTAITDEQATRLIAKYMDRYHVREVRILGRSGKLARIAT